MLEWSQGTLALNVGNVWPPQGANKVEPRPTMFDIFGEMFGAFCRGLRVFIFWFCRNYKFPPLATGESSIDEIKSRELQLSRAEKDDILVFESHLAAATTGKTITKENSLLIDQLISLDPRYDQIVPPTFWGIFLTLLNIFLYYSLW